MLQLRSLNHFVVLAQRLNFARAAEDLGLSQSALTRSIQTLERQLGMRLFDRDRAGVSLTPQGRQAAERATVLLAEAGDLERQLLQSASALAGRVRFGMAPMPARALLPTLIAHSLESAPDVTHEVVVRDLEALWALLLSGDIEFFLSNEGAAPPSSLARAETLGLFPLSLIVRPGHPLLTGEGSKEQYPVVRSSWTGLPLPPDVRDVMRGAPNVIEDFGSLATITATSDAIWFSSTYAVLEELKAGRLCELPRAAGGEAREVRVSLYSLERRSQSPWARTLKQQLRQQIKALAKAYEEMSREDRTP